VIGTGSCIGGFCGRNNDTSTITDSYSTSSVIGKENSIGGFCGNNDASIKNSYATGNVIGNAYVAGFCGNNQSTSTITDSYSTGYIKGNSYVGGFCGHNNGSIKNSYATGDIIGTVYFIGGLSGSNYATIKNSYATGNVIGNAYVAGFCGINKSTISDSYATGNATGNRNIGGFCGQNDKTAKIERSYSIGIPKGERSIGGFCGLNENPSDGQIISSYYDTQTSEIDSSDGGTGKTTAEMMMHSTFVDWDFDNVWCLVEGQTYPQLQYFVDCDTLVSVPEIANKEDIEIYPNPATDVINISIKNEIPSSLKIEIYDSMGNELMKVIDSPYFPAERYKDVIDVSDFRSGVYHIRIQLNSICLSEKIIVIE